MMIHPTALAILGVVATWTTGLADEPPPKGPARVVEGRLLDPEGKPPGVGRVMFGPDSPRVPFVEAWTAPLDAEGRYRIELFDVPGEVGPFLSPDPLLAAGPLRYLVLAAGSRVEVGKLAAGPGPSKLDIRLTPQVWKSTEIVLVDRDAKPIPGAEVALSMGSSVWARVKGDLEGRCRIETPPGQAFGLAIDREGFLPTRLGFRGVSDDPTGVRITLREPIRGRVVDPKGKPLAGIRIGRSIDKNAEEAQGRPSLFPLIGSKQPEVTDAEGRFTLTPTLRLESRSRDRSGDFRVWPIPACFADEAFRNVAFLGVDLKDPPSSREIVLRPARLVSVPIEHEVSVPTGDLSSWWELHAVAGSDDSKDAPFVMSGLVTPKKPGGDPKIGERIEAYWPEGKYRVDLHSADPKTDRGTEEIQVELVVPPGEGPLALPPIRLKASGQHRLIGQAAPELDAKDLDSGKPVRLADFRGKVVVLDFWGTWCGPCLGAMPELVGVHRRFEGKPVVIVALHDQTVQTREEYDRKLEGVKKAAWDGRDLPFLVALDRPEPAPGDDLPPPGGGITCRRYDIRLFPTTLVIDRDGKVAGSVNALEPGKLGAMIESLLADGGKR